MAKRGPKPKPTSLKLLSGTRPDRINQNEPEAPEGIPGPPEHLKGMALDQWHRIAPMLGRMRVLTPADAEALALYCTHFERWQEAEAAIRDIGLLVETPAGGAKISPYYSIASQAMRECSKLLVEFGCTPSARSRVDATPDAKPSALSEYFQKHARKEA